jgi:putative phage-type endonuclease
MLTKEQLIFRKKGIGGSDAAAVLGISPWKSALDVYLDKVQVSIIESLEGTTKVMQRGTQLEPFVRQLFEETTGHTVKKGIETQVDVDHPFMLANVDGFISSQKAIVEFKTASYTKKTKNEWGTEGTAEIPKQYIAQVAHYARVMGVEKVYIGVLFGDEKLFNSYRKVQKLSNMCQHALTTLGVILKFMFIIKMIP